MHDVCYLTSNRLKDTQRDQSASGGTAEIRFEQRIQVEKARRLHAVRGAPSFGWTHGKKEVLEDVKGANVRDAFEGNPYFTDDPLTVTKTPGADDGKPCGNSRIVTIMETMIDNAVSAIFKTVNFEICLFQTINDLLSSLQYVVKVSEELLGTNKFLEPVADVVNRKTNGVVE